MLTRLRAHMAFIGAALNSGFVIVRSSRRGITCGPLEALACSLGYGKSTRSS